MLQQRTLLWLIAVAALMVLVAGCAIAPPVQEMSDARQAIMAAEEADAATLAPDQLSEARRFLAQAEEHLQHEAYGLARMNAVRAKDRAVQALARSQAAADQTSD